MSRCWNCGREIVGVRWLISQPAVRPSGFVCDECHQHRTHADTDYELGRTA